MKKATVANIRNNLSRYLDYVRRGGRVVVFKRDVPVAELVPIGTAPAPGADPLAEHLARLEREGVLRRGTESVPDALLAAPRGRPSGVLDALLEERRQGR